LRVLRQWNDKKMRANLCKLAIGSKVYNIWRYINEIKHGSHPKTEEQVVQQIKWETRSRMMGKNNFNRTVGNDRLCRRRGLHNRFQI
jgi:Ser-tRNA(Ala) deacylase AlaX